MELLYFYIKSDGIFTEPIQINFGGEFLFDYENNNQKITIKKNPYYIKNFFDLTKGEDLARINNVTGVIGRNGAGKSSIIEILKNTLPSGLNGFNYQYVLALINDENQKLIIHHKDFAITKGNFDEFGFSKEIVYGDDDKRYSSSQEVFNLFKRLDVIYFSNVFSGQVDTNDFEGLRNLSTNFLIRNELKRNVEFNLADDFSRHSEVDHFVYEEINRQIDFVNNFNYPEVVPFPIPKYLLVTLKRDLLNTSREFGFNSKGDKTIEFIIDRTLKSLKGEKDFKKVAEYRFIANCFLNYLIEIKNHPNFNSLFDLLSKFDDLSISDMGFLDIKEFILELLQFRIQEYNIDTNIIDDLKNVLDFAVNLNEYIEDESVSNEYGRTFRIEITDSSRFFRFYNLYSKSYIVTPFINFKWRNLSSGELALFNIFSRFYSLSDKLVRALNAGLRRNLLILIDEGELYLHPYWQRQFLFDLIKFLPAVYPKTANGQRRNIQILVTSNTPIVLSDLPNSNVVFLAKDHSGVIKVIDSLEDKKQTFAANIHTLFSDSFFLRDGLVGEFAKLKINQAIEILQGSREDVMKNKDYLEKLISMIGEPVIKSKLYQMFSERLQLNIVDIQDRVSQLEQEVRLLKQNLGS